MTLDIMMPFYGRADHFRAAVDSILAQTDPDWRLLVIDDHNPEEAPGQWLVELGDPRIRYVRHTVNVGINANFQSAIDLAEAPWLTIFGCDDVMLPGYVARIKELIDMHPEATFIHPGTRVIDENGDVTMNLVDRMKAVYRPRFHGSLELSGERMALSLTRGNWMNFPAIAWQRDAICRIGFRPNYKVVQDLALAIDLAFAGARLVVDDQVVFEYRRHSGSVSSWRAAEGSRFAEEQAFFRGLTREFSNRGWRRAARVARTHASSRINAMTRIPEAVAARNSDGLRILVRHILGLKVSAASQNP